MQHISYTPSGVCATNIEFDIDDENRLHNVAFTRGCNGNLKAIGKLVEGKDASEIANILRGNICGAIAMVFVFSFSYSRYKNKSKE